MIMTSKKDSTEKTVDLRQSSTLANLSYDELLRLSQGQNILDQVEGYTLIEDKHDLLKSPFIITEIVFRPSDQAEAQYVSLVLKSKDYDNAVVNDGSTGIRRQVMDYCIGKGWAELTEKGIDHLQDLREANPNTKEGDLPVEYFDWSDPAELRFTDTGEAMVVIGGLLLHAPRGLRKSDYDYEDTDGKKKATTFYLG